MGSRAEEEERAIHAANLRRDAALDRLANEDPTSTTSGRSLDDAASGSSIEVGRRDVATPAQRRDTTGLDLADDDVFGDLGDSFGDGEVPAGLRSADASSVTLSSFRRRSRQSSFIGRADPQIRPSSRGANTPSISSTLHFGNFRRRAREPSILGTARKPRRDGTGTGQEDNSESEEEEFLPEAESTPLNNRRRTQPAPEIEDEREVSPVLEEHVRPGRSRKRKSEDANMNSDRPEKVSRVDHIELPDEVADSDEDGEPDEAADDSDTSSLSSLSSPLGPPMVLPNRPVTPVYNEEDMAPPASSDSEENGDIWPDIHTLAKRRRRPSFTTPLRGGADNLSDMSSPPSLTHSPNYAPKAPAARGRAPAKRQPTPEITTADLTSMLPRRRYKPLGDRESGDDEYDTEAPPHDEDEDELSYVDSRAGRRRLGSRPPLRATSARPGSRGGRTAHSRQIPRSKPSAEEARTYSRQSSDKENEDQRHEGAADDNNEDDGNEESRFEPLPDDTFDTGASQSGETTSADELKKASRKFKEVDRWELEYEEVTQSSSPSGAR